MLGSESELEANEYKLESHLDQLLVNWFPLEVQWVPVKNNRDHSEPNESH